MRRMPDSTIAFSNSGATSRKRPTCPIDQNSMQRQMIAELRHDDMGEQRLARAPLFDRQGRHGRMDDRLAGSAAHFRTHVHDTLEVGRNVFEHLPLVRANPAQLVSPARRAHARRIVNSRFRRQMVGQRRVGVGGGGNPRLDGASCLSGWDNVRRIGIDARVACASFLSMSAYR